MRAAIVGVASAMAIAFAPGAQAQTTTSPFSNIPMTGTSRAGAFTGNFNIDHFEARGGRVFAVGTLVGSLAGQSVNQPNVAIPVRGAQNGNRGPGGGDDGSGDDQGGFGALMPDTGVRGAAFGGANPLVIPAQAACPVLNLVLGPLNLNLLGLVVNLNQVVLNINAQPGAGNLLGNLLCAVAGLLNGLNLNGVLAGAVANLLNAISAALTGLGI